MTGPRGVRALLADGTVAVIRRLRAEDAPAVRGLHENLPERDIYLRFFTPRPAHLDRYLDRMITDCYPSMLAVPQVPDLAVVCVPAVAADCAKLGVKGDPVFGSLIVLGMGGTDTNLIADHACTLVPVTDIDANELLHGLRASAALTAQGLDLDAVGDVLLQVGRLAELLPEVAELDLNPVISYRDGCVVVDARILVRPSRATDLILRELRV